VVSDHRGYNPGHIKTAVNATVLSSLFQYFKKTTPADFITGSTQYCSYMDTLDNAGNFHNLRTVDVML